MEKQVVTPEQLERLKTIQDKWDALTKHNGELRYEYRILSREIEATDAALDELDNERLALSDELRDQFGQTGTVNMSTGEFVPN